MNQENKKILDIIGSADFKSFKEQISNPEIDWSNYEFWQLFVKRTPWNNGHKRFISFIENDLKEDVEIKIIVNMSDYTLQKYSRINSRNEAILQSFKDILHKHFMGNLMLKEFDDKMFSYICKMKEGKEVDSIKSFIQLVAGTKLDMQTHKSFFRYLLKEKDKESENLKILLKSINNRENLEFFESNFPQVYKSALSNNKIMEDAVNDLQLEKIKILIEKGKKLPVSKHLFSTLFCKTSEKSLPIQQIIINEMKENIAWENQVILKSILHGARFNNYSNKNNLELTLSFYHNMDSSKAAQLLKMAIASREENEFIKIVNKHIAYHNLNFSIKEDAIIENGLLKKRKL